MILLLTGIAFGIVGGMGLGGGIVLVPVLTSFFGYSQHEAQALCLICFVPVSICAVVMHLRKKNIDIKKAVKVSLFGIGGSVAGALLANISQGDLLRSVFAVVLLVLGSSRIISFMLKKSRR